MPSFQDRNDDCGLFAHAAAIAGLSFREDLALLFNYVWAAFLVPLAQPDHLAYCSSWTHGTPVGLGPAAAAAPLRNVAISQSSLYLLPRVLLQSRRAAMGVLAGVAALAAGAAPSQAAYGDAANVFGKVTNKSGG